VTDDLLDARALIRAAEAAGFDLGPLTTAERRLEDWRTRGLLPRPTRAAQEGRRSIWIYPAGTEKQLLALLRWRKKSRHLEAIRVALWTEGFPIPLEKARAAILAVLRHAEKSLERKLARFAPESDPETLLDDPQALARAVDGWAAEMASKRSRSEIPRELGARLTRGQRRRAYGYWLATALGTPRSSDEGILFHRLLGLTPRRAGTLADVLDPADAPLPTGGLRPTELHAAVATASAGVLRLARTSFQSTFKAFPLLAPILLPGDTRAVDFLDQLLAITDDMPPEDVALLLAIQVIEISRQQLDPQHAQSPKPADALRELTRGLDAEQRAQIRERQRKRQRK
jgi:hypothetical protein